MILRPVWFDSLGAKSMSVLVRTPDLSLLIDPGAAIMHRGYPAPEELKEYYLNLATEALVAAGEEATHIVITHYHHDHFRPDLLELYRGKTLWIKDPNRWINHSQWDRARSFLSALAKEKATQVREVPAGKEEYFDPVASLPLAARVKRRKDLLKKWRRRFLGLTRLWAKGPWIEVESLPDVEIADGRTFQVGETIVRFTFPLFHGGEYASPGWVLAIIVEREGLKLLYSSDLQGPAIEDYAAWIIEEKPDVLILDGPTTYLLGPFQSRVNLDRAIRNCIRVVQSLRARLIVLDHHLVREGKFREKTREAYEAGAVTAAELLGRPPLTDRVLLAKKEGRLEELLSQAESWELDLDLISGCEFDVADLPPPRASHRGTASRPRGPASKEGHS